jgi:nucleoid-associated protein YgaU
MTADFPFIAALVRSADLSTALLSLAAGMLLATAAWAVLVAVLSSWRPTARWAAAMTPRALRAALFTGVSGAIALAPMRATADDLDGLPFPDRPVTSTINDQLVHAVEPGESLWTIAAATLDADASPATIATETARWYELNRSVIGRSPDLILPGQVLRAPHPERPR